MATIEWHESIAGRHHMPPALLTGTPPMVVSFMLAGSGPMRRPYAAHVSRAGKPVKWTFPACSTATRASRHELRPFRECCP